MSIDANRLLALGIILAITLLLAVAALRERARWQQLSQNRGEYVMTVKVYRVGAKYRFYTDFTDGNSAQHRAHREILDRLVEYSKA